MVVRAGALALALGLVGCGRASDPVAEAEPTKPATQAARSAVDVAVADLIEYAAKRRADLDFGRLPPWSRRSGADPFALLRHGASTLGLLRSGRLVQLDPQAAIVREAPTLPGATALVPAGERLVVTSEARGQLDVFDPDRLERLARISVPGVFSIRDAAWGEPEARLYLADPHRHRIARIPAALDEAEPLEVEAVDDCTGALWVERLGPWLAYDCLLDHRVVIRRVGPQGELGPAAAIEHDGPIWSVDLATTEAGSLWVLAGGVEDRPLDRSDGAFGYIDSFAFVYEVPPPADPSAPPAPRRRHVLNVSEHGVITPKHVRWEQAPDRARVTGYGSEAALAIRWPTEPGEATVERRTLGPGITDGVDSEGGELYASPLLDAWIVARPGAATRVVPVPHPADDRTPSERLGEALAFTRLMAPQAGSDGRRSRFTCETCHFEGRTDGRTHWTGRGQVHATTKTLRGLLNNRPHFSRALDETTARMVHSEFRVANAGTDFDPWFSLTRRDAPWLDALGAPADPIDPVTLRRALIDFLAAFTPEPNPAIQGLTALSPEQAEGAALFEQHCASCHQARLIADDPDSLIPPNRWAAHILHESGGIVWGSDIRAMTGVEPYVYAQGPRTPSLRRLWVKRPLLTNGRASTVEQVIGDFRPNSTEVHGGGQGQALEASQQRALRAFVDLL